MRTRICDTSREQEYFHRRFTKTKEPRIQVKNERQNEKK